ncbi:MAG: methyltransferase domain-containing protein [Proteobacteria bacterium]|nr:methyltransferase domain-containing protein [Pseudomonadota bacterium]
MTRSLADLLIVTDRMKFSRVADPAKPGPVGLPTGHMTHEELWAVGPGNSFVQKGKTYWVLTCDLHEWTMHGLRRKTQIIYPKDTAYILWRLNLCSGKRVGEAGTGSGALTSAMARAVGPEGAVYTWEEDPRLLAQARKNLDFVEFSHVHTHEGRLEEGLDQENLDAFFLDMRHPWEVMARVRDALAPSGHLGILVPTANQVSASIRALTNLNFHLLDVMEIFIRFYKPVPARLRPTDRMVAHTGYLLFARRLKGMETAATDPEAAPAAWEAYDPDGDFDS